MSKLVKLCIEHRLVVMLGVLLSAFLAAGVARDLPIDAVPDVTNVQVQVLTEAPALGPLEIERLVTTPIELVMSGIPGTEEVRSLSRFGLSAITIVFEEGTDIYFARAQVNERLAQARGAVAEAGATPSMGPLSTGLGEIYQFELHTDRPCGPGTTRASGQGACHSPMQLRALLDWDITPQLRVLDGVVEVNAFGGELKSYEVAVDPYKLAAHGLTLSAVYDALRAANQNAGGGYITGAGAQRVIRGEGLVTSLDDLAMVPLRFARAPAADPTSADSLAAQTIRVRDVATVRFAPVLRQGAVTRDGRGEVVTGTVMMRIGANAAHVSALVKDRLDELGSGLPDGVRIDTYYDRTELVDRTTRTVAVNLIEGGALVILVLLLFLGNWRAGLLVASVIPLSFVFTLLAMRVLGISGNLMSLGALDFGLIIDGAIVVVEHVMARLAARDDAEGAPAPDVVQKATREVLRPVMFGTAIIMIVYVPLLALGGVEGKMFRPMAIAVLAALAAALILATTYVPAACAFVFKDVKDKPPWLFQKASALYVPLLDKALAHQKVVLAAAVVLVLAGAGAASRLGAEFVPTLDEGAIAIQAVRPPDVALETSLEATTRMEKALLEHFGDAVRAVVSKTGRPEIATDPMGVDLSDVYVMLHPQSAWTSARTKAELVERMHAMLKREVPGQNYAFSQPIQLRTNELISGARADVAIALSGPDLGELDAAGDRIIRVVQGVPGAADVSADEVAGLPALRITADRDRAAAYGLSTADVLNAVRAIGGTAVGTVYEGQRRFALTVRLDEKARTNAEAIAAVLLKSPAGPEVALSQVAHIAREEGPLVVSRHNAQRRRVIQVNVRGRDIASFVADAKARIAKEAGLKPGYYVTWGGQFKNLEQASSSLALAVPLALALIFLLLYGAFGAARPAMLIFLNIPMAAVGGVFALMARGMPFSISAAVGFIALSGIAVMNGVVLLSTIRALRAEGLDALAASRAGAKARLRAVLMTALTDAIGFLPMALSSAAGAEVQRPLATVVIGGLFTATALTLFVLPVVTARLGQAPRAAAERE